MQAALRGVARNDLAPLSLFGSYFPMKTWEMNLEGGEEGRDEEEEENTSLKEFEWKMLFTIRGRLTNALIYNPIFGFGGGW